MTFIFNNDIKYTISLTKIYWKHFIIETQYRITYENVKNAKERERRKNEQTRKRQRNNFSGTSNNSNNNHNSSNSNTELHISVKKE